MSDPSVNGVEVRTEEDGSLVIVLPDDIAAAQAVPFRQLLVHAVRKVRPERLVVELAGVRTIDSINVGILTALCGLADDHRVALTLHDPTVELRGALLAAGVPAERIR
jgi:anti-anti-sigma regulatory factor